MYKYMYDGHDVQFENIGSGSLGISKAINKICQTMRLRYDYFYFYFSL